jgi:excisionase family DNA binding protein
MQMLTAKDVASLLKLPLARVYELTREHTLPAIRLGARQLRYDSRALNDWIKRGGSVDNVKNAGEVKHERR